ncbi:MAG: hypothetical protein JNK05_03545 [Myxococcales bacterium]|nr:hypothetical protein [Myxococcales bacterium]
MSLGAETVGAPCARCALEIEALSPLVNVRMWRAGRSRTWQAQLHPACALDVDTVEFGNLLERDRKPFAGRDELEALWASRTLAINDRRARQWTSRSSMRIGVPPRIGPDVAPAALSPASDPYGRPRVRVSFDASPHIDDKFWSALRLLQSWPSPKREYVFVHAPAAFAAEDPSQPVIGHVFATVAKKGARRDPSIDLWKHHARGFPPPLLWLIGIKQWKKTDENVLSVREHVASQCVAPDECPVLCTMKVDTAALDALVLALDEHLDGRELWSDQSPTETFVAAFERDLRSGHAFDEHTLERIGWLACFARTEASDAINERNALWLIEHGQLAHVRAMLREDAHTSNAPYVAWFAAALANRAEKMQSELAVEQLALPMLEQFATYDRDRAARAGIELFLAIENPPRIVGRLERVREKLERFATKSDLPMIRAAIDASPSDEHARILTALWLAIDGRAIP